MTNNKQLVSVPRELLDVLRFWLERAAEKSETGEFKELIQLRQLLRAAPAEDVRSVVDESVAGANWQACWTDWLTHHAGTDPDGFERHWNGWKAALHANIKPQ